MPRSTLVTGVNGFVGQHLARALASAGHRVIGLGNDAEPADPESLAEYVRANLVQPLTDVPDYDGVVHLAGLSAVGPSFTDPRRYLEVNGAIALNLLSWHHERAEPGARCLVVSTGGVYAPNGDERVDEESALACTSPYVISKLLVENLVDYFVRRGSDLVVARPFNHIGPGQGPGFLVPDLVAGIRESRGRGGAAKFGDLSTSRDYTDVRDVVGAYIALLTGDALVHRVYNVCSGVSVEGTELLRRTCAALGVQPPALEVDADLLRPSEQRTISGSNDRLRADTGWTPVIPLDDSLSDFIAAST